MVLVDLYVFFRSGKLFEIFFKDGDIILVYFIGNIIVVEIGVWNSFIFEFLNEEFNGGVVNYFVCFGEFVFYVLVLGICNNK